MKTMNCSKTSRVEHWTCVAIMATVLCGVSLTHAAQPNIILIMADDSAVDNYGCYGSTFFSTPRLDELAATGVRFTHCYSEPVCTASRVKIMTGRDNVRNYVAFGTLDKSETTFGTMLKNAGYATAIAGKWQVQHEVACSAKWLMARRCWWKDIASNRQAHQDGKWQAAYAAMSTEQ
jgi:arylsulfatase A-like enzyme